MNYTEESIGNMFCDPFYCLPKIAEHYMSLHQPMVSEEMWIRVGMRYIEDHGSQKFLENLIKNLKGQGDHCNHNHE